MASKEQLLNAKEQAEKEYMTPEDEFRNVAGRVIGIGIGPKITEDKPDPDSTCLRFYVERKIRPKKAIHERFRINKTYQEVDTDVIETGRIVSFQGGPGSSIGFDERRLPANVDPAASGTLGAVVALGGKHYVLGSNHAMAVNGRATGARIAFRPPESLIDDSEKYIFARITDHVHLPQDGPNTDGPNTLDCALAEIEDKFLDRVRAEFPNGIVTSGEGIEPDKVRKVALVDETEKVTTGEIVSVIAQPRFDFSFGSFDFENLVLIEGDDNDWNLPFAKPGDSGAVVAGFDDEHDEYRATAIVIGGSRRRLKTGRWKSHTFACSFNGALAALQEEVVKRLGSNLLIPDKLRLVFSLARPAEAKPAASSTTAT